MMKRKKLPTKKHKGMMIRCTKCDKHFSWTQQLVKLDSGNVVKRPALCGISKRSVLSCKFADKHKYKVKLHISGTAKDTISKTLEAATYPEAVIEAIAFEREMKQTAISGMVQEVPLSNHIPLIKAEVEYIHFLQNIGVPAHLQVERSERHIKEVQKSLSLFNEALNKHRINKKIISFAAIKDEHVGFFHSYLLNDKYYSNKTYNNKVGVLRSFYQWAIDHYDLNLKNPFKKAKNRKTISNKDTISQVEFIALLNSITPEKGKMFYEGKKRKEAKNRYKPFLKDAIRLGLYTGGRREEIIAMKWNMIKLIDNKPAYIEVPNYKVERIKGEGFNEDVAPKIIPINDDLMDELYLMGYTEKTGMDVYILDRRGSSVTDKTLMDQISKGFSHYYGLLNTGKQIQFKHLRKTYLTYLQIAMGSDAKELSSHTSDKVLEKHYIDQKIVSKAQQRFRIFNR